MPPPVLASRPRLPTLRAYGKRWADPLVREGCLVARSIAKG